MKEEKKFDMLVTHRDPLTGTIIKSNPYIMRVIKTGDGGKMRLLERPRGSGNLWNSKNEPVGRWDGTRKEGEQFIKGASHVEWTAPLTQDQEVAKENAALKSELALVKAEADKKKGK